MTPSPFVSYPSLFPLESDWLLFQDHVNLKRPTIRGYFIRYASTIQYSTPAVNPTFIKLIMFRENGFIARVLCWIVLIVQAYLIMWPLGVGYKCELTHALHLCGATG